MLDKCKAFLLLLENMARLGLQGIYLSFTVTAISNEKSRETLARQSALEIIEKSHISVKNSLPLFAVFQKYDYQGLHYVAIFLCFL